MQLIIAGIFSLAMITQSFSFFSKQRMLCIEPSLLHEFNIPLHFLPSLAFHINFRLSIFHTNWPLVKVNTIYDRERYTELFTISTLLEVFRIEYIVLLYLEPFAPVITFGLCIKNIQMKTLMYIRDSGLTYTIKENVTSL